MDKDLAHRVDEAERTRLRRAVEAARSRQAVSVMPAPSIARMPRPPRRPDDIPLWLRPAV